MRHKHADLIHAWAEGAEIEMAHCNWSENPVGKWRLVPNPNWDDSCYVYRIKPTPKPDLVRYYNVDSSGFPIGHLEQHTGHLEQHKNTNLKLTIDGETGKLKSAEVLK